MTLSVAVLVLARTVPISGAMASILLALTTALVGGPIVLTKIGPHGCLVSKVARVYATIGWLARARS